MKTSIFIRTYAKDAPWLAYCLRSLRKFAIGFNEIVVAYPKGESAAFAEVDFTGVRCTEINPSRCPGYIDQQISKVFADGYCTGECILHLDSDCIAKEPFFANQFVSGGRPMLIYRPWDSVGDAICWKEPTQKALAREPAYEFMACLPIIYRRETYARFRSHLSVLHGKDARKYIAMQERFSEFNALGNFAHQQEPDKYIFITADNTNYPRPLLQFWSHEDINLRREELERIVA